MRFFLLALICVPAAISLNAQKWAEGMQQPDGNLYKIQKDFAEYWSTRDITEKGKGYKAFKRWEHFAEPRVYPSGDLSQLQLTGPNFEAWSKSASASSASGGKSLGSTNNLIASSTWTPMGPFGALNGTAGGQLLKSGRVNFITIDPTNTLNLWVGAPAGGLWSSSNGGSTWSTNTDQLSVIGCSDLVIDPTNTSIMYLATGDGDAGDTRSIGVLKSTNGGATWSATGLSNVVTTNFLIRKLLINPSNTQIVMAACNTGIWRTVNGGTNWTQVSTLNTYDLEFKPGDPNTVYAAGTTFRRSTDGGLTWSAISSGLPPSNVQRMAIAVTAADVNYVYVLAANNSNSGFLGLYQSVNAGTAFAAMSTSASINVLGWSSAGTDTGGQGWYDLCIAASPLNKDEVVVGGVNVWRSLNGGATWSIYGHWVGTGAPFTHADQHDLEFAANGTLFGTNDGTVYKRTASAWQEISGLMNISQIYKIGLSTLTANKWITGHQDNGTSIFTGTTYNAEIGGDGMDCFIDRTNDLNVFGETQNGGLQRSTNGGASWSGCTTGLSGTSPWVTVWKQDPQSASTIYVGRQNLFISNNLAATSWTMLSALPGSGTIREFAIAPSNNQVIYVLKSSGIYKTTNGGSSWSTVTGIVPVASAAPEFICISPTDPNKAWVVLSGYSSGNKVFMTANGGTSWTNYSANLPNIPANCCVYQPGSSDMIYVGMDVGVYYRNSTSSAWTLYNSGLPNVPIADMEISAANGLLHAATYGRGVWTVSLFSPQGSPLSMFGFPSTGKCSGASLTFTDQSTNTPNSWSWSVQPATGVSISSSIVPNPVITFLNPGTYTVNLQSANAIGQSSVNSQVITISNPPNISTAASSPSVCTGNSVTLIAGGASTFTWSHGGGTSSSAVFYPSGLTVYTVAGTSGSCTAYQSVTVNGYPLPNIVITGPATICAGDPVTLAASGAANYTWTGNQVSTTYTTVPQATTVYSVVGADLNGCMNQAFFVVGVVPLPTVSIVPSAGMVCLGEAITLVASGASSYLWLPSLQTSDTLYYLPFSDVTFTCVGTDANGCTNSAAITASVSTCESVDQEDMPGKGFEVFPNPAGEYIFVESNGKRTEQVEVRVLDVSGRVLINRQISCVPGKPVEVDLHALSGGTYLLKLKSGEHEQRSYKLIKHTK